MYGMEISGCLNGCKFGCWGRMTKRKREIFTVIESINNWFEASDSITHTAEGSEGGAGWFLTSDTSSDSITTNGCGVEEAGSDHHTEPGTEAAQLASDCNQGGADVVLAAEVAANSLNHTKASTQGAAVPGSVPNLEGSPEGRDTGYYPGTVEGGTNEITGPGTEPERERELTISAFWRLLSDAGYDTW